MPAAASISCRADDFMGPLLADRPNAPLVDPYQVLQVRRDATNSEIRQGYRKLALWNHPGRASKASREERSRRLQTFSVLAACMETLIDKDSRKRCDRVLRDIEFRQLAEGMPSGDFHVGGKHLAASQRQTSPPQPPSLAAASSGSSSSQPSSPQRSMSSKLVSSSSPPPSQIQDTASIDAVTAKEEKPAHRFITCGLESLDTYSEDFPALVNSSSSTQPSADRHYTEVDTNKLFGGPLQLLFRSRRWKAFSDPFQVFAKVFGSQVDLGHVPPTLLEEWKPIPQALPRTAGWAGHSETLPDGRVIFTTTRTLQDRKLTRTEVVRADKVSGQKFSVVTVTSEPLVIEAPDNDAIGDGGCISVVFCAHFCHDDDEMMNDLNAERFGWCGADALWCGMDE